jgi:hypothetical protein
MDYHAQKARDARTLVRHLGLDGVEVLQGDALALAFQARALRRRAHARLPLAHPRARGRAAEPGGPAPAGRARVGFRGQQQQLSGLRHDGGLGRRGDRRLCRRRAVGETAGRVLHRDAPRDDPEALSGPARRQAPGLRARDPRALREEDVRRGRGVSPQRRAAQPAEAPRLPSRVGGSTRSTR